MPSESNETERVFTYVVIGGSVTDPSGWTQRDAEYKRLQESLKAGWQTVDVIVAPFTSSAGAAVTVVLAAPGVGSAQCYRPRRT